MILRQSRLLLLFASAIIITSAVFAQKTPTPTGPPAGSRTNTAPPPGSQNPPMRGPTDLVLFINGKVAMDDGTPLPDNVLIDRVCGGQTREQVHPDLKGNFTFQLGSRFNQAMSDASVSPQFGPTSSSDPNQNSYGNNTGQMGIGRQALWSCEISAEAAGFRSAAANLSTYSPGETIDVGTIYLQRGSKVEGTTISATSYQAPKDAKKAYEKGIEAAKKGSWADAQKHLEKAVQIYPQYATAWHQLGNIYERQSQAELARRAYEQAIAADSRFVPPYLAMAMIEAREGNWKNVLRMTENGLQLDPLDYPAAYYLNSLANYRLNNLEAAEKGARNAVRYDQQHRIPQAHLLLGSILTDSKSYGEAIAEYTAFLKMVPDSKDAEGVRAKVAGLEKLTAKTKNTDQ